MSFTIAAIGCGLFTALLLFAEWAARPRLKWFAKPAAALCFVAAALSVGALETAYGRLALLGLLLCLAGDVLLIPASAKFFLAGVAAFAAGHIAYLAAFVGAGVAINIGGLAAGAGAVLASVILVRSLGTALGDMRTPIVMYCAIISLMVAAAFSTAQINNGGYWIAAAGAAGFALSDISVARDRFGETGLINRLWGLPLYFGSQLLIAASIGAV